jgi:hypothetical protein
MTQSYVLLCALTACHSGTPPVDTAGSQITIIGQLWSHDGEPLPSSFTIAANRIDDDSLVASTHSEGGQFQLTIASYNPDVYVAAAGSGYVTTYYNFPATLAPGSVGAALDLFTPSALAATYTAADVATQAGTGTIEAQLSPDGYGGGCSVVSVVVSDNPASGVVQYGGSNAGLPDPTLTSTGTLGLAYVLNAYTTSLQLGGWHGPFNPTRQLRVFPDAVTQYAAPPEGND